MRGRLLDATIECLVEKGYGAMSTNDVVRRAGVSRGALAHHFPTRTALVVAAAERLLEQGSVEFRAIFLALPPRKRTLAHALDLLWSYYEGPTFVAFLELIMAARTDPELREVLADGPSQFSAAVYEVFIELFPHIAENPAAEQLVHATLALLAGLALQTIVDGDRHGQHAAVRDLVKSLGGLVVPGEPG
jgi:AcrR family transcriptional regulator